MSNITSYISTLALMETSRMLRPLSADSLALTTALLCPLQGDYTLEGSVFSSRALQHLLLRKRGSDYVLDLSGSGLKRTPVYLRSAFHFREVSGEMMMQDQSEFLSSLLSSMMPAASSSGLSRHRPTEEHRMLLRGSC